MPDAHSVACDQAQDDFTRLLEEAVIAAGQSEGCLSPIGQVIVAWVFMVTAWPVPRTGRSCPDRGPAADTFV
jgi:hypothetical protein